jgi:hypothetical protein
MPEASRDRSLGTLASDMNVLRAIAASVFVVSLSCRVAGATDTPLIVIGAPVLQGKDRLAEAWNHVSPEKRTDIQSYLLSLGLSSTGRIHLIGSFRQATPNRKDRNILQFQQTDLEGTRLFWSVLVDPDSLEARVIFSLSKEQHSDDFTLFSTKK